MKEFEILIASPPDREKLVAEIWSDDNLLAEINQESDNLEIEIYASEKLVFSLDDLMEILERAKERLNTQ
jgi:hypothetical protein